MNVDMFIELVVFQSEGIDKVFNQLAKINIKEITIEPMFFFETGNKNDLRLPPLDMDGSNRKLARPIFGSSDVKYGKKYFCFKPDEKLFANTSYRPECMEMDEDFCLKVITRAKELGFKVNIFIPTKPKNGYLPSDLPLDINGNQIVPKISKEACRNSSNVLNYFIGLSKAIIDRYSPDGIMIDWIEYTNYFFSDNFICFCPNCINEMISLGYNPKVLKDAVLQCYEWVKNLERIPDISNFDSYEIWNMISPNIVKLFEFKQKTIKRKIQVIREEIPNHVSLLFTGFAPPMNSSTGLLPEFSNFENKVFIQPKMYRFHWGMMVSWYAKELYELNSNIPIEDWVMFSKKLLEVSDDSNDINKFTMPSPDNEGPLNQIDEKNKMKKSFDNFSNIEKEASVRLHGYATLEEFAKRIQWASMYKIKEISVQRYGYLTDEKLDLFKGILND